MKKFASAGLSILVATGVAGIGGNEVQAAEKAQEARAKVMNLIQAERRAEARAARKARDHALYQSAGLLILAGLVDSQTGKPVDDTAALLGALASLNDLSRDNPKWSDWKNKGQELLKSKKSDSTA